jgi:AraC-like DNA-binding protein
MTRRGSFSNGVVYFWPRGFLFSARDFVVDRGDQPTRRPSIRLMVSDTRPLRIQLSDGTWAISDALLMSAAVKRRQIIAQDTRFTLLDMAVSTPEYAALLPLVTAEPVISFERGQFSSVLPQFDAAGAATLPGDALPGLRREVVHAITGKYPSELQTDPRIETTLRLIQEARLEDISLEHLAESVQLSPGRLRHLFKAQVGCTVSHYARTNAVWKALGIAQDRRTVTEIAQEVGFHDHSHFAHAYREMFGFSLTSSTAAGPLTIIRCD